MRRDWDVVMAAVTANGLALAFVDPLLRRDPDVATAAVASDGLALEFVDSASMAAHQYEAVVTAAVRSNAALDTPPGR